MDGVTGCEKAHALYQGTASLNFLSKSTKVSEGRGTAVHRIEGQPRSLRRVVALIPWLVVAWRGSTSISPLTLSSSKTGVKPEDLEGAEVSMALLFNGSYEEIRSSPTVHLNSPAVYGRRQLFARRVRMREGAISRAGQVESRCARPMAGPSHIRRLPPDPKSRGQS